MGPVYRPREVAESGKEHVPGLVRRVNSQWQRSVQLLEPIFGRLATFPSIALHPTNYSSLFASNNVYIHLAPRPWFHFRLCHPSLQEEDRERHYNTSLSNRAPILPFS